ncbi:MAG: beta strand repeat-containing protein, partial [Sphingobium sp.]
MAITFIIATDTIGDTGEFDSRMVFGDFDNDGDIDILYQNGNDAGLGIGYKRNNGTGTYTDFVDANTAGTPFTKTDFTGLQISPSSVFVVDYDDDGDDDIVLRSGSTTILKNGGGSFGAATDTIGDTGEFDSRMVFGDFDSDGDIDILYQNGNDAGLGIGYKRNNGTGTYTDFADANTAGTPFTKTDFTGLQISPSSVFVIDYDDDGDVDIVFRSGNMTILKNGGGSFGAATDTIGDTGEFDSRMIFGDFDSDGDVDILYQNGNDAGLGIGYKRNDGTGTYTDFADAKAAGTPFAATDFTGVQISPTSVFVFDYDNDGDVDIIHRSNGNKIFEQDSTTGDGSPPTLVSTTPADNATGVPTTANIVLTFDEAVTKGAGNIYIVRTSDNVVIETISVASAQVTGSGTTWTIDPSVTLAGNTSYAIRIDEETFADADGAVFAGIANLTTLNFTTVAPNQAPTATNLSGDSVTYTEGAAAVALDAGGNATIGDVDSANFDGGTLTVAISAGLVSAQDQLGIGATGGVSVAGNAVSVGGIQIATFTGGGAGGGALVFTFDPDATPARVQALVRAITYLNSDTVEPTESTRTITWTLVDGDGTVNNGTDTLTVTSSVAVAAVNDAPSGTDHTATLLEDGSYTFAAADFGFSDVDGDSFSGVRFTTLPGAGTIYLDTNGGSKGDAVAIGAGDTVALSEINAGHVYYVPAANGNGAGHASFPFAVRDNGGTLNSGQDYDQTPNTFTFDVTPVNDAPTATKLSGDAATWVEGQFAVALDVGGDGTISDIDSPNFGGGTLTVAITGGGVSAEDILTTVPVPGIVYVNASKVVVDGVEVGTVANGGNNSTLVFSFDEDATPDVVQRLVRAVAYMNSGGISPTEGVRTLTWTLVDGDGTANTGVDTLSFTTTVDVLAINDAPAGTDNAFTINEDATYTFNTASFGF